MKNLILLCFVVLFVFTSCKYQKILKSKDYNLKYEKAVEYYKKKDYVRAIELFEQILPIFKGTEKGEEIAYYYAYANYYNDDYIIGGHFFRKFVNTYPKSSHAEECQYMSGYCYFLDSPKPSLDQSTTFQAIDELQLFITRYPRSSKVPECNNLIDKLRDKLEVKSYKAARLYFDMEEYKAAIIALKNALKEFPDSQFREELMYLVFEASFQYAKKSIDEKLVERYENALKEYSVYIETFPNGEHRKDADKLSENIQKQLKKLKTEKL